MDVLNILATNISKVENCSYGNKVENLYILRYLKKIIHAGYFIKKILYQEDKICPQLLSNINWRTIQTLKKGLLLKSFQKVEFLSDFL
jgi:hypothetical protein